MLTIDQKQKIYEHLLTLNCPDLLAALIADRCDIEVTISPGYISSWVSYGFSWDDTNEGYDFWDNLNHDLLFVEQEYQSNQTEVCVTDVMLDDLEPRMEQMKQSKTISDYYISFKLFVAKLFYRV